MAEADMFDLVRGHVPLSAMKDTERQAGRQTNRARREGRECDRRDGRW